MMSILLINPDYAISKYMGKHLARVGWVMPPMGLLYIAAALEEQGFEVVVYDAQVADEPLAEVISRMQPGIVGITCVSALFHSALTAAELVKDVAPEAMVVVGGVHPTVRPLEVLASEFVDGVVRGEGIDTMVEIAHAHQSEADWWSIRGTSWRTEDGIVQNLDREPERMVDRFPFPARHLVPMDRYRMSPDWSMRRPFDIVFTAFGCPFDCIFCAAQLVSGGRYRMRSIDNVMQEIDHVIGTYRLRSLLIGDDSFVVSKERVLDFCDQYTSRGYHKHVPWQVSSRVDSVDFDTLRAMKKAGCFLISFGVESGVPRLLDLVGKRASIEQSERAVRLAKEAGLKVRGTLILGLPTETREESLETIRFSKRLPLDQVRFALATPFPGTELWRIAEEEGQLAVDDWMSLSLMGGYREGGLPYVPKGREATELKRLQRWANLSFFFQPRAALGYVGRIRSLADLGEYAQGAWQLLRASVAVRQNADGEQSIGE